MKNKLTNSQCSGAEQSKSECCKNEPAEACNNEADRQLVKQLREAKQRELVRTRTLNMCEAIPADRPRAKIVADTARSMSSAERPLYHEDCSSHAYAKKAIGPSNGLGGLGMAVANRRSGNDGWRDRYLLLQAEMIDDGRRWFSRIENLVQAQVEQIREVREETERAMEAGFEEAYKMLREVAEHKQLLETENKQLRDRVKQLETDRDDALSRRLHEIE